MSVCIRTISNKLSLPFVGTGKTVSPVDRQLTKNVKKTTAFLEEFFGAGANFKSDTRVPITNCNFLVKPLETTSDNVVAWNYKLNREKNWCLGNNEKERLEEIVSKPLGKEIEMQHAATTIFSTVEKKGIVNSQNQSGPQAGENPENEKTPEEKLSHVYEVLRTDLPNFFIKSVDYRIYHQDIVFENNIKGTVTKGIYEYVKQTAMLRIFGHLKFAYVKFEVLKMTMHPEDNSVKVRWRIRGMTGTKVFINFWRYKVWNLQRTIDILDSWYDGFSTFYVDIDSGKVIKHVADKMMPDQDREVTEKDKAGMAAKLALFLGLLTPREFLADIAPLVNCSSKKLEKSDETCRESADTSLEKFE